MDFDFPAELKQLAETARAFLRDNCPTAVPRRVLEEGGGYDRALWRSMADMGWLGAAIPEAYGGAGLGHLAVCVLAEEVGRAIAPVPFASSVYLATEALLRFADPELRGEWLPKLAGGSAIGTVALAEGLGPMRPDRLSTRCEGGRLFGIKAAVADGSHADFAIVAARAGAGDVALHLVDLGGAGVTRSPVPTIDPSRDRARLVFDGAVARPLAGAVGQGAVGALLDRAACMMAFEQLGLADRALEMARDYALARYAFGRPIGSFQAIKHKLADVYVAVTLARSNAYWAAWALDSDADDLPLAAAAARISACDAGWLATKENIQTHGGMGYTWELDCHLYYRRAKLLGLELGSGREWKHRLMAALRSRDMASAA